MKKILSILLCFCLAFGLASCGTGSTPSTGDNTSAPVSSETTPNSTSSETPVPDLEPVIAVDNEYCTIKITGIDPDNLWGYTLTAYLENKSADTTYMFSVTTAAVNGVQTDPLFASEVAPGKKSNTAISFADSTFESNGIEAFTDIELSFRVYDSNDWTADPVAEETVHLYPYGEENATHYVRESLDSDTILVDNDHVTVIVTGYDEDDIWGYAVNLFIVNKSDKNIMISADEVSVNGYMADPFYATTVTAGKCAFSSMSWFNTTFEENGITHVEEIEFLLRIYDADDWMADNLANETIVLNP